MIDQLETATLGRKAPYSIRYSEFRHRHQAFVVEAATVRRLGQMSARAAERQCEVDWRSALGAVLEPGNDIRRVLPLASLERSLRHARAHPCRLDVFGKTEAAGQCGVGEKGDLVDLAAAEREHHHAPGLGAQVVAERRLAVGACRPEL